MGSFGLGWLQLRLWPVRPAITNSAFIISWARLQLQKALKGQFELPRQRQDERHSTDRVSDPRATSTYSPEKGPESNLALPEKKVEKEKETGVRDLAHSRGTLVSAPYTRHKEGLGGQRRRKEKLGMSWG